MSLLESEQRRSRRAQRKHRKAVERKKRRTSALAAPLAVQFATANDAQFLTFFEWCQLNRFSESTGRRILASGDGPVVTQLGPKRIGVTVANNRRWQQMRARS